MFAKDDTAIKVADDTHGFRKLLILLTEPGKVFALSSFDGQVKWQFYVPQEKILKLFIQQTNGKEEVVLITPKAELRLDPSDGRRISMYLHKLDASEFNFMQIRVNMMQQAILAVPKGT